MKIGHTLFLLAFILIPSICIANTDDPCADESKCTIDKRRYVDWNTPEYNKIVGLKTAIPGVGGFTCTAQYVAPNIIMSAGHCTYKDPNVKYYIIRSDKPSSYIPVTLLKYNRPKSYNDADWAIFKVNDPKYYNKTFYTPAQKSQITRVSNAGWGSIRVLTDTELNSILTQLQNLCHKYDNCLDIAYASQGTYSKKSVYDSVKETRPFPQSLKVSQNCNITDLIPVKHRFRSTCYIHPGNSGGPFYYDNTLYGIVSQTGYNPNGNGKIYSTGQGPEGYYKILEEIIRKNPVEIIPDPTPETPVQTEGAQAQPATVTPTIPDTTTETQTEDQAKIEQEITQQREELTQQLNNIDNANGSDVLNILFGMSELEQLQEKLNRAKEREQSLENRILGAAAIGATGIGAMNMMSGMAEQKADDAAEEDMRAYLATFVCDYGQGRNIKGGETNIDLPGGNDLFSQVNEYRTLAADLKARKEALGKTPGIESEIIYDISETGLYDNVGMGRQSGAYASISKALTDETGVDAARWAEQKSDASSKVKTGAITAGIGAVGGAAGNVIINQNKNDDKKPDTQTSNTVK